MNITRAHPLWIFIFPHRNNPARRFNHAANLSACVLIRRFFLFDSTAGYKVTPRYRFYFVVDTQMDFIHGGYSKTPPYMRYMRYILYRSSLSQSRNRDTRNTCQLARLSKFYQAKALEKYSIARSIASLSEKWFLERISSLVNAGHHCS